MQSEFNDSIELNNNLYFVGHTNNTDQDIIIASYTNSGEFNINFNETGVKVLDFGGDESATAIISGDDDLFIAFTLNDGTSTEACLLKMDLSGTLSDDSGELDSGYLCTQYLTSTKINDLAFTDNKVQAVGQYDNGTDLDSLWIKYDKSTLAFESGPIVTDISGIQQDDASFAIKSFGLSELMIVGSTTTAQGDKSAVIRYLLPDGTNSPSFNSDSPMIIDLSSINQDDELLAIGGADADDFTALLGGYTTLDSGEQEAVLIAIDKNGDKTTAFGTEGIAIFDIDGNAGAGNGGTNITGVEYEPINNQVVLVGTTGIDHDEQVYSARINPTTGELDSNYANSGINIVSNINGKQSANAVSVDENDTLWISGALEDANTLPFITAIDKQAELVTDFSTLGYLTLTELHDPSDDAANTVLQLTHAEHAGKYLVAATAEFDNEIKLVLARYTETGEIDTNFSSHGQRTLDISLSHSDIAMVEDSNGDILIAGSRVTLANDEGFIVKLDQNGDLVSEFASDGIYGTSDTTSEQVSLVDIAIDSNNNTAAVGTVNIGGTARSFIVLLDDTGVRDHDFSNNGAVTGTQNLYYQRVHFNNNNEIIVAGKAVTGINASHFAIKYTENGGQAFYSSASQASLSVTNNITAILTDTSGNIYLIGNNGEDPTQAVVIKLLETGEVDTSFAVTGTGHYNLTASENTLISAAVLDSAGRIILAGQANNQGVLARIATDGTLDSGFGSSSSGYFESELCDGVHAFSSIHLLDDTQIVATNTCTGSISSDISLSKFNFYPDGVEP
ncbi:hypothetical protein [Pseudoalteromonas sp. MMG010]|uniref:hypothetical protein n=1 Tax=Pseudoalteromonas sp. MMG010 TaxID=2822685 RepID=UPI0032B50FC7